MPKLTIESDKPMVLIPLDEYEALMERVAILSDSELMEEIRDALRELEEGKAIDLEEFWQKEIDED